MTLHANRRVITAAEMIADRERAMVIGKLYLSETSRSIARAFAMSRPLLPGTIQHEQWRNDVEHVCDALSRHSKQFHRALFRELCGK